VFVVSACIIDATLDDKSCPCAEGWECNEVTQKCVDRACSPQLTVRAFSATFATPHAIRWEWQLEGTEEEFLRYEVVVAETKADLQSRTGSAIVFDAKTNPELGEFYVPFDEVQILSTVTRGLEPDTTYYARLYAVDGNDCGAGSDIIAKKTPLQPLSQIVLFGDASPEAGVTPRPVPGSLFEGQGDGTVLRYDGAVDTDCVVSADPNTPNKATCGQPVGVQGLDEDITVAGGGPAAARVTPANFNDAYLEVEVEVIDSPVPLYYAWVWLLPAGCVDQALNTYESSGIVVPNSGQRILIEAPLNDLRNYQDPDMRPGTGDEVTTPFRFSTIDVANGGTPICGFALGGQKHKDGDVIIHGARIVF
jgi:hypothetical protein